tara:strand:- start:15246 stop:16253 length:1008 start_codon:yes stop_codon:yes gene_type:complete
MATTQLSDIIEPSVFTDYVLNRTKELSALFESEVILPDSQIAELAMGGGATYNMPFWNDLGNTESNVGSDNPASSSTALKIDADQDVSVKHFRNQSWSTMNLAGVIAGDDPMKRIGDRVATYWSRDMQRTLIASLNGVIADNDANDSDDMIHNVATDGAGAITDAELLTETNIVNGLLTMGDALEDITAMAMHSVTYGTLVKRDLIDFIKASDGTTKIPTYLGRAVIVDDGCPAVAGSNRVTYTTFLFGRGAIGYGEGAPKKPTEVDNAPAAGDGEGQEFLYSRRHYIMHPRGIKFTSSSVAGKSPTNTELAAAANWDRVYERKQVRLAAIKTNG